MLIKKGIEQTFLTKLEDFDLCQGASFVFTSYTGHARRETFKLLQLLVS